MSKLSYPLLILMLQSGVKKKEISKAFGISSYKINKIIFDRRGL